MIKTLKLLIVTGASSFIGKQLVQNLLSQKVKIRVVTHKLPKVPYVSAKNLEFCEADFNEQSSLINAFAGGEKLFSLTPSIPEMLNQGINQIKAAKQVGINFIVRISGFMVNKEYADQFQLYHEEIENVLATSGIPHIILRPNTLMQEFIRKHSNTIKSENKIYSCVGKGKVSYIDTRDIAAVASKLLLSPHYANTIFKLTGPQALDMDEVALHFSRLLKRKIEYINLAEREIAQRLSLIGKTKSQIDKTLQVYKQVRDGYKSTITNSVHEITGRAPINFETFVKDHLNFFK